MRYKLVKCPRCRNYFITRARKRVKCIYCGRSFSLRDRVIKESNNLDELRLILTRLRPAKFIRFE